MGRDLSPSITKSTLIWKQCLSTKLQDLSFTVASVPCAPAAGRWQWQLCLGHLVSVVIRASRLPWASVEPCTSRWPSRYPGMCQSFSKPPLVIWFYSFSLRFSLVSLLFTRPLSLHEVVTVLSSCHCFWQTSQGKHCSQWKSCGSGEIQKPYLRRWVRFPGHGAWGARPWFDLCSGCYTVVFSVLCVALLALGWVRGEEHWKWGNSKHPTADP